MAIKTIKIIYFLFLIFKSIGVNAQTIEISNAYALWTMGLVARSCALDMIKGDMHTSDCIIFTQSFEANTKLIDSIANDKPSKKELGIIRDYYDTLNLLKDGMRK